MKTPGPRCAVHVTRRDDGLSDVWLVDPRTGRRTQAGAGLRREALDGHVRQVRRQLERAGERVEHTEN